MRSPWIRFLVLLVVLSINLSPLLAQAAQPADGKLAAATPKVYIIQLQDAPLASYRGGLPGLEATNPGVRGERRLDLSSPASVAYLNYLQNQQALFIQTMEQVLGRPVEALYQYRHAFNGMAISLTPLEAEVVTQFPGVRMVQQETIEYPLTDRGPTFIGAPAIWDGSATPSGVGSMGEGIIIGIIDTGINHASPSFADVGGDGYDHENPWGEGNYVGVCETDPGFCNDKLIGAWCMVGDDPNDPNCPEDSNGHGSHTSSTAGGNFVDIELDTPNGYVYSTTVSGVAPHANIVMYDACVEGCPGSALLASADQALIDGVDVINYSISGGTNPYYDSVELAFLALADAGVYVSTSAGNNGPSAGTVAHRSPWVATTAASTHDRTFINGLIDMEGDTEPPEDMWGQSVTIGYGPEQIVYVTDTVTTSLCLEPFPAGTFEGEIVVCDRGIIARVDKGLNVLAGGAGGLVLVNTSPDQNIAADAHYLPAVHLNSTHGDALKAWLTGGGTVFTGTIAGSEVVYDPDAGDIVAGFSSRGPNTTFEVLKPDMAAPGVAILAASRSDIGYEFMQGTSMASPHNAGAGALLMAVHPEWSPAEIKSALMTTVETELISEDTGAPSTPFDKGAGRDELTRAALAGLVLHEGEPNYSNANPDIGGDPKTLNLASMANEQCFGTCSFTRTVSSTLDVTSTWRAVDDPQAQFSVTVTPSEFTLPPYGSQTLVITADVEGLPFDAWAFAYAILTEVTLVAEPDLTLTKDDGGITVRPGETIVYTLGYSNTGDAPSTGALLTETVPAGTSFNPAASDPGWTEIVAGTYLYDLGTIDPHVSGSVAFAVDVDEGLPTPNVITNTAYLGDDYLGMAAWASTGTPVALADLQIVKDDGGVPVSPGDRLTYTLAYSNEGSLEATGVMVTETLPAGTSFNPAASDPAWSEVVTGTFVYSVGALGIGMGDSVVFVVDVDEGLPAPSMVTNTAYIGDDYFGTAAWTSTETPVALADVQIVKDDGGVTVSPGDMLTYTLAYTNAGSLEATGVIITETLPAGTSFNPAASDPAWSEVVTGTFVYSVGTLGFGEGGSVLFVVDVDDPLDETIITNSACIGDDMGEIMCATTQTPVEVVEKDYYVFLPIVAKGATFVLRAAAPVKGGATSLRAAPLAKAGAVPHRAAAPANRYAAGKFARPAGPIVGLAPDVYLAMAVQPWAPPPLIDVDPEALASSQEADVTNTVPFTVSNVAPPGYRDLEWELVEDIIPSDILADWGDSFDTYAVGSSMHGQGGWKGWGNDPAYTAYVTDTYAQTPNNAVNATGNSDLVHEYSGYDADQWVYTAWQYIPSGFTGESYFILLNSYDDAGLTNNWSTQVNFNGALDQVVNEGVSGGTLSIAYDRWVEIRVEIDLDNDAQTFYYDGQVLYTGTWTEEVSGGGVLNIGAVDLFANGASPVFYDSLSLEQDWGYWTDFFDIYDLGSSMHGQGGWKGWGNDPAYTAYVTDTYAQTPNNAVNATGNSDLVHEYSGYDTDLWVYTIWQYIPSGFTGESYFILLNSYDDAGLTNNWSTQVNFNGALDQVVNEGVSGGTLSIAYDQWVEIRVEIDLINDAQTFYYDGQVLYTGTWTEEVSGGGVLNIGAVDLFANGASPVFYDTASLVPAMPEPCQDPSDIPWLSVAPDTGVTPPGGSSTVGVTFNSTGVAPGTYNSTLCVFSNDVITPVIPVPVTLTVTTP